MRNAARSCRRTARRVHLLRTARRPSRLPSRACTHVHAAHGRFRQRVRAAAALCRRRAVTPGRAHLRPGLICEGSLRRLILGDHLSRQAEQAHALHAHQSPARFRRCVDARKRACARALLIYLVAMAGRPMRSHGPRMLAGLGSRHARVLAAQQQRSLTCDSSRSSNAKISSISKSTASSSAGSIWMRYRSLKQSITSLSRSDVPAIDTSAVVLG